MGMVTFGFGLLNVPGIVMSIFIGLLLIAVIAAADPVARACVGSALRNAGKIRLQDAAQSRA